MLMFTIWTVGKILRGLWIITKTMILVFWQNMFKNCIQEFFGSHKSYNKSNPTQFVFFGNLVLYVTKGCYQKSFYWKSLVEAHDF
jgi:hypothetical protein